MVLDNRAAAANPFWMMVPEVVYWPVLVMATIATVIASQAVITGAFSVTQQAVQLGLLPRIDIRNTSESQAGQIFVPSVNMMLMVGVLALLVTFQTSANLAAAYGIAVTGSMFVDSLLAWFIVRKLWKWSLPLSLAAISPLVAIDLVFLTSNMLKIQSIGYPTHKKPLILLGSSTAPSFCRLATLPAIGATSWLMSHSRTKPLANS
jgi:KUP system potassium uptake protein